MSSSTLYDCPNCGWVSGDEPPAAVREYGPNGNHTAGHSDQSTHECPECGEESFWQGWAVEGTLE